MKTKLIGTTLATLAILGTTTSSFADGWGHRSGGNDVNGIALAIGAIGALALLSQHNNSDYCAPAPVYYAPVERGRDFGNYRFDGDRDSRGRDVQARSWGHNDRGRR